MSMMLAAIYGGRAAPEPEPVLIYDNFDGPLNDPLHNRESDSGHIWSDPDNFHSLDGDGAAVPTVDAEGSAWIGVIEAGQSDGIITVTLNFNTTVGLVARYVDEDNFVLISIDRPSDFVEVYLLNFVAGTPTEMGWNPATPISGETTVNVILDGSNVSVEVGENELVSASIADHVGATQHGFNIFSDPPSSPSKISYWEMAGLE